MTSYDHMTHKTEWIKSDRGVSSKYFRKRMHGWVMICHNGSLSAITCHNTARHFRCFSKDFKKLCFFDFQAKNQPPHRICSDVLQTLWQALYSAFAQGKFSTLHKCAISWRPTFQTEDWSQFFGHSQGHEMGGCPAAIGSIVLDSCSVVLRVGVSNYLWTCSNKEVNV